jgi:class 3 adenylate cyclase
VERLSFEDLARESGTPPERLRRLIAIGVIVPENGDTFRPGDIQRAQLIDVLLAAGIELDEIAVSVRDRWMDFSTIELFYPTLAPLSGRTQGEFERSLGPAGDRLGSIYAAFGLAAPGPDQPTRLDEEAVVMAFLEAWDLEATTGGQAPLSLDLPSSEVLARAARIAGDAARRFADGWIGLFHEAVSEPIGRSAAPIDAALPVVVPRAQRVADAAPLVLAWLYRRHLTTALHQLNIDSTELGLAMHGITAPRPSSPPAIAFVDLAGYTELTHQLGDEQAVRSATTLADSADTSARRHQGRLVKVLGDGVLLRFGSPRDAVDVALELVEAAPSLGLPPAHAGVAAGPIIDRDGDVFGHTVNVASRLSGRSSAGRVLVDATVAQSDEGDIVFEPAGALELKGIVEPVPAFWAARAR